VSAVPTESTAPADGLPERAYAAAHTFTVAAAAVLDALEWPGAMFDVEHTGC